MIVHFVSLNEKRIACGAYSPPIMRTTYRWTEDACLATCKSCQRGIEKAAKTGEMIFSK